MYSLNRSVYALAATKSIYAPTCAGRSSVRVSPVEIRSVKVLTLTQRQRLRCCGQETAMPHFWGTPTDEKRCPGDRWTTIDSVFHIYGTTCGSPPGFFTGGQALTMIHPGGRGPHAGA